MFMESISEAIEYLNSKGYCALCWDHPATPGALAVASGFVDTEEGIRIFKHMVLVVPSGSEWTVSCDIPGESRHPSLAEAVEVAAALVTERQAGGIPSRSENSASQGIDGRTAAREDARLIC
jgi:hypothetical protein